MGNIFPNMSILESQVRDYIAGSYLFPPEGCPTEGVGESQGEQTCCRESSLHKWLTTPMHTLPTGNCWIICPSFMSGLLTAELSRQMLQCLSQTSIVLMVEQFRKANGLWMSDVAVHHLLSTTSRKQYSRLLKWRFYSDNGLLAGQWTWLVSQPIQPPLSALCILNMCEKS